MAFDDRCFRFDRDRFEAEDSVNRDIALKDRKTLFSNCVQLCPFPG